MVTLTQLKWIIGGGTVIVVICIGIGIGWLKLHDAAIRAAAVAELNQKQLEQVLHETRQNQIRLNNLATFSKDLMAKIMEQQAIIDHQTGKIDEMLNSPEMQQHDRDSSKVLKETIRQLRGDKNE